MLGQHRDRHKCDADTHEHEHGTGMHEHHDHCIEVLAHQPASQPRPGTPSPCALGASVKRIGSRVHKGPQASACVRVHLCVCVCVCVCARAREARELVRVHALWGGWMVQEREQAL